MALSAPSMTLDGSARVFIRINHDNFGSTWRVAYSDANSVPVVATLKVSHKDEGQKSGAGYDRHIADLTIVKRPAGLPAVTFQSYYHIRTPRDGTTVTEQNGFAGSCAYWANSVKDQLVAWEN